MTKEQFDNHRFCKNETVTCMDKVFRVHSVNFESGMVGIHNEFADYEVLYQNIEIYENS